MKRLANESIPRIQYCVLCFFAPVGGTDPHSIPISRAFLRIFLITIILKTHEILGFRKSTHRALFHFPLKMLFHFPLKMAFGKIHVTLSKFDMPLQTLYNVPFSLADI